MSRLFVGLDIPKNIKSGLEWISTGIPNARWTQQSQMHLTLRFLGEVDGQWINELDEVLSEIRQSPFKLSLQGVGHFPPRGKPQVLWAGVDKTPQLMSLEKAIRQALDRVEVPEDKREFHPHITLARCGDDVSLPHLAQFLSTHSGLSSPEFTVDAFHLYSSARNAKGSRYTIERTYNLEEPFFWEKRKNKA